MTSAAQHPGPPSNVTGENAAGGPFEVRSLFPRFRRVAWDPGSSWDEAVPRAGTDSALDGSACLGWR